MTPRTPEPVLDVFRRTLDWFQTDGLEPCVMGGLAFQVHGIPRATFDVDVTVAAEPERIARFLRLAGDQGAIVDEPFLSGWTDELAGMRKVAFLVLAAERLVPGDVFLVTTPFQREAFARRVPFALAGRSVAVVTIEDLRLFKLIAGRRKDEADAVDLLAFGGPLDVPYVRRWTRDLGLDDCLRRLAAEAGRADLA